MSDLSVSSAASSTQQSAWAQRKTLFDQLGQALQKGDLKAAQTAYAALQKNAPQGPRPNDGDQADGQARPNPLAAVGQALQSGDLAGAQQAFNQIPQGRGHHHHRHQEAKGGTGDIKPTAPPATPSTSPSTTPATAATASTTADKDGDKDSGKDVDQDEARKSRINLTA